MTANRAENLQSQGATKKIILPILLLCQWESLVSSKTNSKQLSFHIVRPNIHIKHNITIPQHKLRNPNMFYEQTSFPKVLLSRGHPSRKK